MSSWWVLQTSQRTSRITCRRTRLVFEGKAFLQARHSRFLTLLVTFKFQMVSQRGFEMSEVEERNLHFGYMVRSRYQLVEFYTVGFFSVVEASKSSKEFSRISLLQVRDSWSMKLLTVASGSVCRFGEIIIGFCFTGSQLSRQILIDWSSPTLHTPPRRITSLPLMMLFHPQNLDFFASITEYVGEMLHFKNLVEQRTCVVEQAHVCFAKRALLNMEKSLNPLPPWVLGLHTSCHLI